MNLRIKSSVLIFIFSLAFIITNSKAESLARINEVAMEVLTIVVELDIKSLDKYIVKDDENFVFEKIWDTESNKVISLTEVIHSHEISTSIQVVKIDSGNFLFIYFDPNLVGFEVDESNYKQLLDKPNIGTVLFNSEKCKITNVNTHMKDNAPAESLYD
ncbi:hypothetical protein [Aliikangiella maris]|uniref:Uncharacterized protein n=2 Tax=Aliikangiella maris TaxID=3162458 RepID=A0ABV2C198_9GAMM